MTCHRHTAACLLALMGLAIAPAPAGAATSIGQLDPGTPSGSCIGTSYFVQSQSGGPSDTVPAGGGVITSWSHKAHGALGRELGLRVLRPLGGTSYRLVGTGGVQVLTPSIVNTFPTRIRAEAGDLLGLYIGNPSTGAPFDLGGGASCAYTASSGNSLNYAGGQNPEPAVGSTVNLGGALGSYRLNLTAVIEPDADADGYGDETRTAVRPTPAPMAPALRLPTRSLRPPPSPASPTRSRTGGLRCRSGATKTPPWAHRAR